MKTLMIQRLSSEFRATRSFHAMTFGSWALLSILTLGCAGSTPFPGTSDTGGGEDALVFRDSGFIVKDSTNVFDQGSVVKDGANAPDILDGGSPAEATVGDQLLLPPSCGWTDGVDHHGKDWVISLGEILVGRHRGIGLLKIPAGIAAVVKPYDGAHGGLFEVCARTVVVQGTLSASGAGYGGGGGGGGGAGSGGGGPYDPPAGIRGAGVGGGLDGSKGGAQQLNTDCGHATGGGGNGGAGGKGGGPFGGAGGKGGHGGVTRYASGGVGVAGANGGYAAAGRNGDSSTDMSLRLGSGGGGGGGGGGGSHYGNHANYGGGGGGGGGAGGRGGGAIKIIATVSISVAGGLIAQGKRAAGNGADGKNGVCRYYGGAGGRGGDAAAKGSSAGGDRGDPCLDGGNNRYGGKGNVGGGGAGGGILLRAPRVEVKGTLDVRGTTTQNGGTVKVFYQGSPPGGVLRAGRTLVKAY